MAIADGGIVGFVLRSARLIAADLLQLDEAAAGGLESAESVDARMRDRPHLTNSQMRSRAGQERLPQGSSLAARKLCSPSNGPQKTASI